ncbi:MarR family transcriptional regulator [Epidermidibacterium keratini]|uniref:MarR family transcriptional regulator n=1 Tax=Epidermidibacterium keratini TaxID=1891644 RepID=A0A7L4YPP5_9ACTN|nr:MarR family transcriptional regulator [Epidermidibacterium keratini]QHC01100.1 MarR family transcriptional regulator [Epidermidibacterium keratini]
MSSTDDGQLSRILASFHTVLRTVNQGIDHLRLDKGALIVLYTLHVNGTARPSETAGACQLDQSTVSRHLKALEDDGLVSRSPDPHDKRAQIASITEAGTAFIERVQAARIERLSEALNDWSEDEREQLAEVMGRLADSLVVSSARRAAGLTTR